MSFLISLYLLWIAFAAKRLIRLPLPRPADVIQLSLFFYNVPLAFSALLSDTEFLADYAIFLNSIAGDHGLAEQTLLLTISASLAVSAGRRLGTWRLADYVYEWSTPITSDLQRTAAWFCLGSLVLVWAGIALFGVDTFFAGYAIESTSGLSTEGVALTFFAYEVIGVGSFIWFLAKRHTNRKDGRIHVGLAIACLVGITVIRGKRLELIIALLPLFLLLWSTVLVRPIHRIAVIFSVVMAISAMASIRQGEVPDAASLAFNTFSEGLYAGHVTPGVIEAVQHGGLPTENGMRFVAAIAAFIPRFLLPNKDELIYKSLTDIGQFAPQGATSFLAETYLQGGLVAVTVWFTLIGFIGGRFELDRFSSTRPELPIKVMLYALFVCSFVPHFRDGLIPAIKIPMQLLLAVAVILFVSSARINRRRRSLKKHVTFRRIAESTDSVSPMTATSSAPEIP